METAPVENSEAATSQDSGPGGKLQAARLQLGMSIGDVAERMHLSNTILEALEDNNFDEITAPIFVKGYLRAYARILSIDEEAIISEYIQVYSDEDPPITTTSNTASEISASDTRVKWMTYLVILVLIALIATWWWSDQQTSEQLISLDAEQTTTPEVIEEQVDTAEPEASAGPVTEESSNEQAVLAGDEPAEPATEETLPLLSLQPETSGTEVTDNIEPVTAPIASTASSPVSSQSATERRAPTGDDQFLLVVNADTWADIKDATGFQLIYDLMRADSTLMMTGTAPFEVFLGNGHGVDVEINGEPVDITSFIRDDNTARFQTDS